jgi:hypothetical protein
VKEPERPFTRAREADEMVYVSVADVFGYPVTVSARNVADPFRYCAAVVPARLLLFVLSVATTSGASMTRLPSESYKLMPNTGSAWPLFTTSDVLFRLHVKLAGCATRVLAPLGAMLPEQFAGEQTVTGAKLALAASVKNSPPAVYAIFPIVDVPVKETCVVR